jgi:phage baseplate assembly protein W
MKTLTVQNGDLQLDSSGRLTFQTGSNKLVQDLTLWLEEPIGTGYTTPNFGSLLPNLIGQPFTAYLSAQIQSEILRIFTLYQTNQIAALKNAQNLSQLGNWSKSEIINSIDNISVYPDSSLPTMIDASVDITTLSNTSLTINLFVTSNGIQVNS